MKNVKIIVISLKRLNSQKKLYTKSYVVIYYNNSIYASNFLGSEVFVNTMVKNHLEHTKIVLNTNEELDLKKFENHLRKKDTKANAYILSELESLKTRIKYDRSK